MDLNEKFEINKEFRMLKYNLEDLVIFEEKKDEDIIELYLKAEELWNNVSCNLTNIENEFKFFNSLHKQTKYDNIISLIKICERLNTIEQLNIDKNKIVINIANPDFNNVWNQINDMIEIPQDIIDFIDEYDRVFKKKETKEKKEQDNNIIYEEYIPYGTSYEIYLDDEEFNTLFREVFRND